MNHIKKNVLVDTYHLNNSVSGIGTYTINLCLGIRKIKSNDFQFIEFPKFEKSLKFNFFKGPISWEKKNIVSFKLSNLETDCTSNCSHIL